MAASKNLGDDEFVPLAQAGVSRSDVEKQLARVCDSSAFGRRNHVKNLFRHLVRESLANNVRRLNVADITKALYKRYNSKNSRARVDARTLREALKEFYASDEARPRDIRFDLPQRQWVIYAPRNAAGHLIATICEPAEGADVYRRVTVRGTIDGLDLDLRPWLVVRVVSDGDCYPQRQVRRNNPEWQEDVTIGMAARGINDGGEFEILLVAVDFEGDFDLFQATKLDRSIGHKLPADTKVLDSRRVTRRDIRPQR